MCLTFLDHPGLEPTNNAAERALCLAVSQRKISQCIQEAKDTRDGDLFVSPAAKN